MSWLFPSVLQRVFLKRSLTRFVLHQSYSPWYMSSPCECRCQPVSIIPLSAVETITSEKKQMFMQFDINTGFATEFSILVPSRSSYLRLVLSQPWQQNQNQKYQSWLVRSNTESRRIIQFLLLKVIASDTKLWFVPCKRYNNPNKWGQNEAISPSFSFSSPLSRFLSPLPSFTFNW